jgi:hypothetical protein
MRQGLKEASYTYLQFIDLVFGFLLKTNLVVATLLIISTFANRGFSSFMNDYIGRFVDFDSLFEFLYKKYFLRIAFGPVYLSEQKTKAFIDTLDLIGFTKSVKELRPLV